MIGPHSFSWCRCKHVTGRWKLACKHNINTRHFLFVAFHFFSAPPPASPRLKAWWSTTRFSVPFRRSSEVAWTTTSVIRCRFAKTWRGCATPTGETSTIMSGASEVRVAQPKGGSGTWERASVVFLILWAGDFCRNTGWKIDAGIFSPWVLFFGSWTVLDKWGGWVVFRVL